MFRLAIMWLHSHITDSKQLIYVYEVQSPAIEEIVCAYVSLFTNNLY